MSRLQETLKEQIKRHEGFRRKAYKDSVGIWTIGYGRNMQSMYITRKVAEDWLSEDISNAEYVLLSTFPYVASMTQRRRDVLVNMTFNLGIEGISRFKKMWKALDDSDYERAADEMIDSKWYNQVGKRAQELEQQMRRG